MITVAPLQAADRPAWQALFEGYIAFYERAESPSFYEHKWAEFQDGTRIHALGAFEDGVLLGITHFFAHPSTSGPDVCYLQDLFTAPAARGRGVGRALIAAVEEWARERGCGRLYWQTKEDNATARLLYDKVATLSPFVRYVVELG
ncbi:N-acetyltransferase [Actinorhabdospora filicis]|uniref:N-acetyltransferase n=1 Tax=Actinorhabdospora filicis TaxID=1785913 RepID=A0A9W6SRD1_9ACTN|nr:GNAT family N-acetyltransferase [Actinorhabdospora filicis]GLZ80589.1 N-acetyltransferase [Actinorhabdospora filicis]